MDAKTLKLYDVLTNYRLTDFGLRKNTALKFAEELTDIHFDYGFDAVEFLYLRVPKIFEVESIQDDIAVTFLAALIKQNRTKTVKNILASPNLITVFFTLNRRAFSGETLDILITLLTGNKLADAEKLFKALYKNAQANYAQGMVAVFDGYSAALIEKQGGEMLVPDMPKKTAALLQACAEKIKGGEKPLLLQRIRELL